MCKSTEASGARPTHITSSLPPARCRPDSVVCRAVWRGRCVVPTLSPNPRENGTTVTFHNYAICRLPHDHPTSGTRQQRQRPDLRPPQAAGALKIALQGAHAVHVPTGALEELDQSTLLLLFLSVLCASHVQVMPMLCGGIDQSLYCLRHDENIGPPITFCEAR